MATCAGGGDNSSGLEDLMKEITCSYCSKEFCDPRSLNCHHAYCTSCLETLASEQSNTRIACPACGKDTQLLAAGVHGLPVADDKINLKKIAVKMLAKSDDVLSICVHHTGVPCDLYCHACRQCICRDCILTGEKHAGHHCQKLEVVANNFRQEFNRELLSLLEKLGDSHVDIEKARKTQECLQKTCQTACDKICKFYNEIIQIIEEKKREEIEEFHRNYEADFRLKELESRIENSSRLHDEIQSIQRRAKQDNSSNDIVFMKRKKDLLGDIIQTHRCIDCLHTEPPNNTCTRLPRLGMCLMEVIHEKIPKMYKFVDPLQCTIQATQGSVNELLFVTVTVKDSDGSPCQLPLCVKVKLHSLTNRRVSIEAEVYTNSFSIYTAKYTPTLNTRGPCELVVHINGDIVYTQKVFIKGSPGDFDKPVHILPKISAPGCLRTEKEGILIICRKDECWCIMRINTSANPLSHSHIVPTNLKAPRRFWNWCPAAVAFSDEANAYYITDSHYNMVHMFSVTQGKYVRYIGGLGHQRGKFHAPNGICIIHRNIYICDCENHRIQVFNDHLNFVRCFGLKGKGPGKFNGPYNIAFDSNSGHIFVAELRNHHIQCLTESGEFIRFIGSYGAGPGKLNQPKILLIHQNHIYVSDNDGISIFTLDGGFQFVKCFATTCSANYDKTINGLAIDKDGFLYVSDGAHSRVVIF